MLYVNDHFVSQTEHQQSYSNFARHPLLANCRGMRFAICLEDPARWISLCLYLRDHGASVFPIHPTTPRDAAERLARRARCHVFFFGAISAPSVAGSAAAEDSQVLDRRALDTEAVLVQMSSGTTGAPKCIERSWAAIGTEIDSYIMSFNVAAEMTPVVACPTSHSYGLICGVLVALTRGQTPVIVTNMNPRYLLRRLSECERPLLYAAPALLNTLMRLLPENQRFHAVMTSGAPMNRGAFEALKRKADHVFQQYGCSEAGCVALNTKSDAANAMGRPLPHVAVVAGENADTPAEIRVEVGQQTILTRDLGYLDECGVLCFVARLDDTINVAGINVYPGEIEDIMLEYPDIDDAVAYKKTDPYAGERVCLKFTASVDVDIALLRAWCTTQLSPYQIPVELIQVTRIPRSGNGKTNRRQLVEDPTPAMVE
ncbi:MAG: acyl-CoA synthase [Alteromonadaceae bacterium]|nr:acyl-CoA synthase [Alteromonadaceae bacterium]